MRITYLWDADYPWDVRTQKVCQSLAENGHHVEVVARNRGWNPEADSERGFGIRRMHPWRLFGPRIDALLSFPAFFNPRWVSLAQRSLKRHHSDLLIVRDIPLAPTAIWAARQRGIPVMLDMAENYPAMIRDIWDAGRAQPWDILVRNPRMVRAVERWVLRRVDHVLTVVEESSTRISALGVDPSRISVVSNTPPKSRALGASKNVTGGPLRIVYIGLLEVPRGIHEMVEAAAILSAKGISFEMVIVGGGRDQALFEERAHQLGIASGGLVFLGQTAHDRALAEVAAADVGVVPHHATASWNSTIPNKLFDYMASGLPVVCSDALPAARIVRETGAGLVFRSRDAGDLASSLEQLLDVRTRERLSNAGRRAIRDRFNWEEDTQRMLAAVDSVAKQAIFRSRWA